MSDNIDFDFEKRKEQLLKELTELLDEKEKQNKEFNEWKRKHPLQYKKWLKTSEGKMYVFQNDIHDYFLS